MKTYNVFYSAKAGVDRAELENLTHEFVVNSTIKATKTTKPLY